MGSLLLERAHVPHVALGQRTARPGRCHSGSGARGGPRPDGLPSPLDGTAPQMDVQGRPARPLGRRAEEEAIHTHSERDPAPAPPVSLSVICSPALPSPGHQILNIYRDISSLKATAGSMPQCLTAKPSSVVFSLCVNVCECAGWDTSRWDTPRAGIRPTRVGGQRAPPGPDASLLLGTTSEGGRKSCACDPSSGLTWMPKKRKNEYVGMINSYCVFVRILHFLEKPVKAGTFPIYAPARGGARPRAASGG